MTVSAKWNALLDLLNRFRVGPLLNKFIDRLFIGVADHVMKVNDGRVRKAAKRTVLRRFKFHPQLAIVPLVFCRNLLMFLFISLIPAFICLFVFFPSDFEILVRHLLNFLSPVKAMDPGPGIARFEQLITPFNQTVGAGWVGGSVTNNPFEFIALGVLLTDGNHAFL